MKKVGDAYHYCVKIKQCWGESDARSFQSSLNTEIKMGEESKWEVRLSLTSQINKAMEKWNMTASVYYTVQTKHWWENIYRKLRIMPCGQYSCGKRMAKADHHQS